MWRWEAHSSAQVSGVWQPLALVSDGSVLRLIRPSCEAQVLLSQW